MSTTTPSPFKPGDQVRHQAGGGHGVILSRSGDLYNVAFPGVVELVHGDELQPLEPDPHRLLCDGVLGDHLPYALRLQALYLQHAYRYDPLSGLSNARIEPALHQVFVALRVTQKLQPRMILADEVGLGKTIEAGLVIKELRARGLADRVLVVCPANLQLQWQQELRSKFNERFDVLDGPAVRYFGRGGTNPWTKVDNVITSLPFASHSKRADQVAEGDWDLVVFDEAHRVRRWRQGRSDKVTQAYRLADELQELTNGILLLTATPMQLQSYELYSLIELVEPGMFPSFEAYEAHRLRLPGLNEAMKILRGWHTLAPDEQRGFCVRHRPLLRELGFREEEALRVLSQDAEREQVMDLLAEKHPLSSVLVRNRKAEIGGFVGREAHRVPVELTEEEEQLYEDVTAYCQFHYSKARASKNLAVGFVMVTYQKMLASSSTAIRESLKRRSARLQRELVASGDRAKAVKAVPAPRDEQLEAEEASAVVPDFEQARLADEQLADEIAHIERLVERLGDVRDSKATTLVKALRPILSEYSDEKAIVFTTFMETQRFLRAVLEAQGFSVAVFNGSMSLDEKEAAVKAFRADTQVLISTEAGGEGRNFQFCHILVNYDLPWNPMKVEQRIGRLDRIGQRRKVEIFNLACRGTLEERVLDVLDCRIGLFEESVGSLDPILGEVEQDIEDLVMRKLPTLGSEMEEYEVDLERRVREAREKERTLADFAMDRASLRRDFVNRLLDQRPLASASDLQGYCSAVLDYAGGALTEHSEGGQVISLSPRLSTRLRTRQPTVRGAFDPLLALRMEDQDFFAFGHELVDRLVDLPISEGVITGARIASDVPAGCWVEVWYELRGEDVRVSGRFVRHLVSAEGVVRSEQVRAVPEVGEPWLGAQVPDWAPAALAASQSRFAQEFDATREEARAGMTERQDEAVRRATRVFEYRSVRLQQMIDSAEAWIGERELDGSERDRRVLPARKGRLAKDKERLQRLRTEFEEQLDGIRRQEPRTSGRMLAAGLVMGR